MKVPPPPIVPPPPPPIFVGADEKKRDNDLGAEIITMLSKIIRITYVPGWQEMLYKFKAAVQPGGVVDAGRLPYSASGPNLMRHVGKKYAPLACLYTRLTWIIVSFWQIVLHDEGGEEDIRYSVQEVVDLIEHKDERGNQYHLQQILSRCNVVGNERDGYELEWRGTL